MYVCVFVEVELKTKFFYFYLYLTLLNNLDVMSVDVKGPGMLSRAVWSRCMLGVLSSTDAGGRWDPSGSHFLSSSRLTLGEWRERIGQLQDLSAVIWDNMAMPELADFR